MARYPEFSEYETSGNFKDGIKRCDDLLKKHPKDAHLLSTKLQLLAADNQDGKPILEQMLAIEPPIRDVGELFTINIAMEQVQRNEWPRPKTAGPEVARLWDNAAKTTASVQDKHELLMQRFETAVALDCMVDAQQALIQLKALQPKNRMLYMTHAAVTQLTSASKDDMQSRLALMLAKKAVKEKFDAEKQLDCRVPGQIFALQNSTQDLESIEGTSFAESKQVYEAVRATKKQEINGSTAVPETVDPSTVSPAEWLSAEIASLKARFAQLIEAAAGLEATLAFAASAMRLFSTSIQTMPAARSRTKGEACFLAVSALVKSYELSQQPSHLLVSAHLAETLLQIDTHIHEARMILVYLYMRLGLGALAVRYFDSLNIKEIQLDTVGHALFTNLSYIYPQELPLTKHGERNPKSRLSSTLQVYERCEQRLYESEADVLRSGQTGMIFDLHELRDKLRSSVTRRITCLELRRHTRVLQGQSRSSTGKLEPKRVANWIETTDNRDFAATFDYGYNVEKALYRHNSKLPGREWVLYGLAVDVASCLAKSKVEHSPISDPESLLAELESGLSDLDQLSLDDEANPQLPVSNTEHLAGSLVHQCLRLALLLKGEAAAAGDLSSMISSMENAVERLHIATLCETNDVCTKRLKDHHLYFDVLRTVAQVCELAISDPQTSAHTDALKQLLQKVRDDMGLLRAHAEEQCKCVNAKTIRAEMSRSDEGVFAAVQALGEDGLTSFCEAVEGAAREGWSLLGKLKT